ncbi:BIG1-domain-containing protein [Periconia macrospinosa]|uniref:Protein BIG1 n=1 Tax=Periconia macrospinosa TaxID=97972 RepID=A0A2V1DGL2_9PLEO|nr:BIG1-domain-containing protein [Periconia macrospinosa]
MVNSFVGALALASVPSALAFRNSSPYFLFSTAELLIPSSNAEIAPVVDVTDSVIEALKGCPTKSYIFVQQDGVSQADYLDKYAAPRLSHYLSGKEQKIRSTMAIPEVISSTSARDRMATPAQQITDYLQQHCGAVDAEDATDKDGTKFNIGLDAKLEDLIVDFAGSDDYTVIYTTTPRQEPRYPQASAKMYEMESPFADMAQMELKRDLSSHKRASSSKKEGALFERYQYFSPGIFMAIIAIVPLFSIIFVGLRALTSLEVSYFAFSKEMGPAAQRK